MHDALGRMRQQEQDLLAWGLGEQHINVRRLLKLGRFQILLQLLGVGFQLLPLLHLAFGKADSFRKLGPLLDR